MHLLVGGFHTALWGTVGVGGLREGNVAGLPSPVQLFALAPHGNLLGIAPDSFSSASSCWLFGILSGIFR